MQTLSESVATSLQFMHSLKDEELKHKLSDYTASAFCLRINHIADMLNCKNVYSKKNFAENI